MSVSLAVELLLNVLLAATLGYCIVLERRLAAVRKGQDGLKGTIADLNTAITSAGSSMRALKTAAAEAHSLLDNRLERARAHIDELSVLTASAERIADRIDKSATSRPAVKPVAQGLPSQNVMGRLDALRAVR